MSKQKNKQEGINNSPSIEDARHGAAVLAEREATAAGERRGGVRLRAAARRVPPTDELVRRVVEAQRDAAAPQHRLRNKPDEWRRKEKREEMSKQKNKQTKEMNATHNIAHFDVLRRRAASAVGLLREVQHRAHAFRLGKRERHEEAPLLQRLERPPSHHRVRGGPRHARPARSQRLLVRLLPADAGRLGRASRRGGRSSRARDRRPCSSSVGRSLRRLLYLASRRDTTSGTRRASRRRLMASPWC